MTEITDFKVKKIITVDPRRPVGTHVAVRGGESWPTATRSAQGPLGPFLA